MQQSLFFRHAGLVLLAGVIFPALLPAQPPGKRGVEVPGEPPAGVMTGKTYALLIGISHYQHDPPVQSLQFADKDAETFAELLSKPLGGGLQVPTQIRLLTNEKATRAAINASVKNISMLHAGPNNTLILFVAAHGVYLHSETDPVTHRVIQRDPYILTYDSNPQDPKTTGYPMDEFRRLSAEQAAVFGRVLVFVDVCHADNVGGIAGGSALQGPVRQVFEGRRGDLGLIMAAQASKFAYESASFGGGHGAFSYFLIAGLNGKAAAPDASSITFEDLTHYVDSEVYLYTRRAQSPTHHAVGPHSAGSDMILVPDVHRDGIKLKPAKPISATEMRDIRRRRSVVSKQQLSLSTTSDDTYADPFEDAIAHGRLLPEEPGSASRILAQLRQDPNQTPADLAQREEQLHVALADRGQQTMSRYLDGEQEALKKPDFDKCARDFEEAFRLAPDATFDQSRALFCQGRALIFIGEYDRAEALLNQSVSLDARRAYAYNAIGIAELERSARTHQGLDAAASAFQTAMRFAPYWAYPIHNLALLESERGNYDEAIRLYQFAMSVAPRYSYLPYNLGLLYERLGDLESAKLWYKQASQVAKDYRPHIKGSPWPERAQVWNALGTVARTEGHTDAAKSLFQKALDDDSANANARHNMALILAMRKDLTAADRLWQPNLALTPKFMPSWIAYADSLAARGSTPEAIETYERIVADFPDYVGAREALARLYIARSQFPSAIAQLNAALKQSQSNAVLYDLRGDAESRSGLKDAAREDWNRALGLAPDRAAKSRITQKLGHS